MTFIQTYPDESDDTFRRMMQDLLTNLLRELGGGEAPENRVTPFSVGRTIRWAGMFFREVKSVAGSPHSWLWLQACRGWSRGFIQVGAMHGAVFVMPAYEGDKLIARGIFDGEETWINPFDYDEVK